MRTSCKELALVLRGGLKVQVLYPAVFADRKAPLPGSYCAYLRRRKMVASHTFPPPSKSSRW